MWWLLFIPLQLLMAVRGLREARCNGTWSWFLFFFVIGFLVLETCLVVVPVITLGATGSRYFVPVWTTGWIVAALNFIWFIRVCRGWRPPNQDAANQGGDGRVQ
jgi:hypothetical protein